MTSPIAGTHRERSKGFHRRGVASSHLGGWPLAFLPMAMQQDQAQFVVGWAFLFVLLGAIVLAGHLHWGTSTCGLTLINATEYALRPEYAGCREATRSRFLPDVGAWWYYWRLAQPTVTSRTFVWCSYTIHQISTWWLQYRMQSSLPKYSTSLRWYNVQMFLVHAVFHGLHLLQTHTTYDGLHGDVSFQSSQASVIVLLAVVYAFEAPVRGMFFGIPSHRGLARAGVFIIKKYHGYFFNYAAVWTFWCHPMEPLWGFLMGFSHTFLIMLQGSLAYTEMHRNPYWRALLESWVLLHATLIAIQTMAGWEMFFWGFLALVTLMAIPGLPFLRRQHLAVRLAPFGIFVGSLAAWLAVSNFRGSIMGLLGIPIAEIMVAYAIVWMFWLMFHPSVKRFFTKICCCFGLNPVDDRLYWTVFGLATAITTLLSILDWHLPYAAWLANPSVPPRTYIFSYIGMAVSVLGQTWSVAMLLGAPPPDCYGAVCGVACAGKPNLAYVTTLPAASESTSSTQTASAKATAEASAPEVAVGISQNRVTLSALSKHNTARDCWIAINGGVYDVTAYLKDHPGGPSLLLGVAGADATSEFETIKHSKDARRTLAKFRVGEYDGPKAPPRGGAPKAAGTKRAPPEGFAAPRSWSALATLTTNEPIGTGSAYLTFVLEPGAAMPPLLPGQHLSLSSTESGGQIRSYTPVEVDPSARTIRLAVKAYPLDTSSPEIGAFSRWLVGLAPSSQVRLRAPSGAAVLDVSKAPGSQLYIPRFGTAVPLQRLGLVAGGTGVTPVVQMVKAACERASTTSDAATKLQISVLISDRTPESALLADEIEQARSEAPSVVISVHKTFTNLKMAPPAGADTRRVDRAMLSAHLPAPGEGTAVLVCGPTGFETDVGCALDELGHEHIVLLSSGEVLPAVDRGSVFEPSLTGESRVEGGKDGASGATIGQLLREAHANEPFVHIWLAAWTFVSLCVLTGGGTGRWGQYSYPLNGNQTCDFQHGFNGRFAVVGAQGSNYQFARADPTWFTVLAPWLCYFLHQIPHLFIILYMIPRSPAYSSEWRWWNWYLFYLNVFALCLKYLQTNISYDGLAAHLPLAFGIGTVAGFLSCVYTMMIPTRGLIFGCGKRIPRLNEAARFVRKWHGAYISFAIVNDFWYHPFEAHAGHQLGILTDCLLLWQSTIIYTHNHRSKVRRDFSCYYLSPHGTIASLSHDSFLLLVLPQLWCLCLELIVLPHSALIAFTRSNGVMAGQFGFGYLLILILHQMWSSSFSKLQRLLLAVCTVLSIALTYQSGVLKGLPGTRFENGKGFRDAFEVVFMPILHFLTSFAIFPLFYIALKPLISLLPSKRAQMIVAVPSFMVVAWGVFFGAMLFIFSRTG